MLRKERFVSDTDISRILNDVAEPGLTLCRSTSATSPSGIGLGDSAGTVTLVANPSGYKVHGVLLQNFVNVDTTKFHINWFKDEQLIGSPANVLRKGWVTTNNVIGTPSDGDKAYLTSSGNVTPTLHTSGGLAATPFVGQFDSIKDQDGYVKLVVNLPQS